MFKAQADSSTASWRESGRTRIISDRVRTSRKPSDRPRTPPVGAAAGGIARLARGIRRKRVKNARDLSKEITLEGRGRGRGGKRRRESGIHKRSCRGGKRKKKSGGEEDRKINEKYKEKEKSGGLQ